MHIYSFTLKKKHEKITNTYNNMHIYSFTSLEGCWHLFHLSCLNGLNLFWGDGIEHRSVHPQGNLGDSDGNDSGGNNEKAVGDDDNDDELLTSSINANVPQI